MFPLLLSYLLLNSRAVPAINFPRKNVFAKFKQNLGIFLLSGNNVVCSLLPGRGKTLTLFPQEIPLFG